MEREKCVRAKFSAMLPIVLLSALLGAFGAPLAAQNTAPAYLFLLEGKGVPTGTIHSFSLNTATGALTEVPGSPFSAGLGPEQMAVDPTGRFLYVANQNSQDITAFSIDPGTGSLALIPGSPFFIGAEPVTMETDPTGRFLYVFAGIFANDFSQEQLFEYDIDSVSGALTLATSSPTIWVARPGILITSIVFNAIGSMAYLGRTASAGQQGPISICTVDFTTGALAQVASVQPASPQSDHLAIAPAGNFLFSASAQKEQIDAFAIGAAGGLAEISGSPYPAQNLNVPAGALVHASGNFLYVVNENQAYQTTLPASQFAGSIFAFGIHAATGSLSPLQGSPFPAGINASSIGMDPTGSFAFVPSTNYVTGTYKGFAQILGFSIDPSSGALSPFPAAAWTDSAQSTGSQLVISGAAPAVANPAPAITSLSPSSVTAAGPAFTLQINGTGFVAVTRAYFGGLPRATTFVSSTQLDVNIPATDIANEGTAVVFVFNPLPGGGASTSAELTVMSPAPAITLVSPTSIVQGKVGAGVTIIGSNFLTSSIVNFNGSALTTLYISSTAIRALIPSSDLGTVGTATITVTNPSNGGVGGGTSNALTINIVPPTPKFSVTGISPTSAQAGGPAFTLTVSGTAFVAPSSGSAGTQVTFGLASVPTTFVSSTQLTVAIPATAIAIAGNPYVIVTNPDGSTSTPISFTVTGVNSVNPPGLPVGSSALTLNVTGAGFEPSSIVLVNGSARPTTYVNSTLLQVTLLPSDIAQGGTLNITVLNPPPGGGVSPAVRFMVEEDSLSLAVASKPINAGDTASFTLTFSSSSGTISNPVDFTLASVTPHAAGAAASFAPSPTMPAGASPESVVLSVRTQSRTSISAIQVQSRTQLGSSKVVLFLLALIWVFSLTPFWFRQPRARISRLAPQLLTLLLLCSLAGLASCAGSPSGTSTTSPPNPPTGTPAGTYTITVTATSAGVVHNIPVTLRVM